MTDAINIMAIVLAAVLLIPVAVLCVECLAAVLSRRITPASCVPASRPRLAVLVPAHDEETGVAPTLRSIQSQLLPHDRLVVVADNCTDSTAAVARSLGAEVIERNDADHRGKGYALDRGVRELESDPPEVLVMVDADCSLAPGALTALAEQVVATGQPAQAAYVLDCPPDSSPRSCVSALAFIVKNVVRPTGLSRLGLPCLLTGTGMAFPWSVIRAAHLASGNIVEDMQLGLDLAIAGHAPRPCPAARVAGSIAEQSQVAYTQRTRWEHGHLQTLLSAVPRLTLASAVTGRPSLLALALELAVPPLALLALLLTLSLGASAGWAAAGGSTVPAVMLSGGCAALLLCALLAWARFARSTVPFRSLAAVPLYVLWKVPLYAAFLFRRQQAWVRTERQPMLAHEPATTVAGPTAAVAEPSHL